MTSITTPDTFRSGNNRVETRDAGGEASRTRLRPYRRFANSGLYRFRVPHLRFMPFRVQ